MEIEGKVVIATGAGGDGSGRAIARRFAHDGAAVVVSDINEDGGNETVALIESDGGRAVFHRTDIRVEPEVHDLIDSWESLTPEQRIERQAPSRLLQLDEVADMVVRLATDESLFGRILVWWSEDPPQFIPFGDRGYAALQPW